MEQAFGQSQASDSGTTPSYDMNHDYQTNDSNFEYQTITDTYNYQQVQLEDSLQNWEQLVGETTKAEKMTFNNGSQTDLISNVHKTNSFDFQQDDAFNYLKDCSFEEISPDINYETIIQTKKLYNDPEPKIVRKPVTAAPLVYNQKVTLRFLKPPPIEQGPLIIREVRPPQPPPLPPLVIRQHPRPARSPSPLILREKPPPIPDLSAPKVVTKTLPAVPPPPRSVIIERFPPLPAKPRDVIIERWIPYEHFQQRKVIVQRAEPPKPYPRPRNVIIIYEPVQPRIVRHVERVGVQPGDPRRYVEMYGNTLLQTEQLLAQTKQLGINDDLLPPNQFACEAQKTAFNTNQQNYGFGNSPLRPSYGHYAPTFENLVHGSIPTMSFDPVHEQKIDYGSQFYLSGRQDLSNQFV